MRRPIGWAMALWAAFATAAGAEPCSSDSQCNRGFSQEAQCIGDMLIVSRSICVAGQCQRQEVRRESCGGPVRGACIAGAYEYSGSRCDSGLMRCVTRTDRDLCTPYCDCRGKELSVSTGQCTDNLGCTRTRLRCEHGCTCSPTPRCLGASDAPPRKRSG